MKSIKTEEIKVRRVKRKDFSRVFELIYEAFPTEISLVGFDPQRLKRLTRIYSFLSGFFSILDFLHIDFETILVAVADDKVVGELHLVPHGKKIWSLDSSAVDKRFRGRGIYRKLMQESLKYIFQRHGERIVTSLWTTNVPAVKITAELKFETFEEQALMRRFETGKIPTANAYDNIIVRELNRSDSRHVLSIIKTLNRKKAEVYGIESKDFLSTNFGGLRNKLAGMHTHQWVLEVEGKLVGYAKVTFTSPKEAGSIESFYVNLPKDSSKPTGCFLAHILTFLTNRNITQIVSSLNTEWKEIVEVFEFFGFKRVATVYEMVRQLS